MLNRDEELEQYILDHIDPEPADLHDVYRHTHLHHLYPRMCSGHYQGRLLKMLVAMVNPARVLELGTFTGYSTLCFAEAMPEGCTIDTIEIDPNYAHELRAFFDASGRGEDIRLHIGDALELIDSVAAGHDYDMVFIDADKRHYADYYHLVMEHTAPGAFILADNTLWDGKVTESTAADAQTAGIRTFNDLVAADPRVAPAIVPVRDGLTILYRLS